MVNKKLNALLANYEVMYHKIQTYHWYIKGSDFFQGHAKLEEYYNEFAAAIDEIAEILLMVGGKPLANLGEFSKNATIKEAEGSYVDSSKVFKTLLKDFSTLRDQVIDLKKAADKEDNYLVSAFADELIGSLAKSIFNAH